MRHSWICARCALAAAVVFASVAGANAVDVLIGPTLTMDPNGVTPLAGVVEMVTDIPVQAELTVTDGTDLWTVTFPAATTHYLPVMGLKADRNYTVEIRTVPGGYVDSLIAPTDPLPSDFPVLTVVSNPAEMEPGYTLLDYFTRPGDNVPPGYPMIVDSAGDVVWYGDSDSYVVRAITQLENGNMFFRGGSRARERDLLGNFVNDVFLEYPGLRLHHDLYRTSMGTYLGLDRRTVQVEDFPTSTTDPDAPTQTADVRDEPIEEFLPDGTLRSQWPLVDLISPTRIGYLSLRNSNAGYDWGHTNSVIHDPSDDSIIVSVRHQDCVIKFSRQTGELIWILGNHDNWPSEFQPYLLTPVNSPFRWQYAQHAAMLTGDGTLILFDNGNNRASPFDGNPVVPDDENFSRGVEYEIDEQAMEVRQVWEYGEFIDEPMYSYYLSDADWLPITGNVLMTFGGITYTGGVSSADLGLGEEYVKIVEATDDVVPVEVFELTLYNPAGAISLYRSERIPSLYPQRYIKPPNGIGYTLRLDRASDSLLPDWTAPPTDANHDEAEHYIVYASDAPDSGFSMIETSNTTGVMLSDESTTALRFYKVVAANLAGKSWDIPPP